MTSDNICLGGISEGRISLEFQNKENLLNYKISEKQILPFIEKYGFFITINTITSKLELNDNYQIFIHKRGYLIDEKSQCLPKLQKLNLSEDFKEGIWKHERLELMLTKKS